MIYYSMEQKETGKAGKGKNNIEGLKREDFMRGPAWVFVATGTVNGKAFKACFSNGGNFNTKSTWKIQGEGFTRSERISVGKAINKQEAR